MMNKNATWFHSMGILTDSFRTTHNWAQNEISWWGYICHLYQIRFQVKDRMECNNHYRNYFYWVEKQLKKELKKLQLCVNNKLKHVQIANDIGQFAPSEFKKKAASTWGRNCPYHILNMLHRVIFSHPLYKKGLQKITLPRRTICDYH